MASRILLCTNCGSEKLANRTCEACRGLSDEDRALDQLRTAYAFGEIDLITFEKEVELVLTNPSASSYMSPFDRPHLIYR